MAFIDGNYPNKIKLARYKYLIKTLMTKKGATRERVGDVTAAAMHVLREDYGKEVSLLELLEGVNQSISYNSKIEYSKAISLYVVIIGQ